MHYREQGHDSISKEKVFQKTKRTILMNIQVNRRKSFRFCAFIKVVESQWADVGNKTSALLTFLLNYHSELDVLWILLLLLTNVSLVSSTEISISNPFKSTR